MEGESSSVPVTTVYERIYLFCWDFLELFFVSAGQVFKAILPNGTETGGLTIPYSALN